MYTKILGTGGYLPETIRTNADLEKMVETSNEWIVERTGILERRIASENETAAFMGAKAGALAIEESGLDVDDIDAIICATTSSQNAFPSSACEIGRILGIKKAFAFDVAAACAGFSYAYSVAHAMIMSGQAKNILVVGVDSLSKACDPNDRTTIILFGDGAGAIVLGKSAEQGTLAVNLGSDPSCGDLLLLPNLSREHKDRDAYLFMKGNDVFKRAVSVLAKLVSDTLEMAGMTDADLDFLVPHQANLRIISATARKLHMDMSQVIVTLDKQGNTSAASVPLALDEGIRSGRIIRGNTLLLESFGGGFTWGAALVRY
ncbi:beta-ketoacyl-ACP synthase III [Anaerobiospirillum thomasii]|uniref:Beta-ketoacyl-[acyl-carrier-protein] synthase III n=1 Tax=Anaerobiospirillum thomasii TaxID=179995 RepID=A0A2X0V759_9GAMM|nr:beta-ketoacyl-ACP synthase III [Anaerobiospirillum thomasii]SPT70189.1 3-oxoacyl-[acyl-carrier-protein] synthase 3 [Anaerobiospirillum thomasii]